MDLTELGAFLKSRRDRIRPQDVGLPAGPRRRVAGLRRDEVAVLAGASVDYYVELEQGRGAQPSEQMVAALARALRLDRDERDHLYHLAGRPLPTAHGAHAHVHPAMLDLLDRLGDTPARVITDLHVTLVQNRMARALLGEPSAAKGVEASFVHEWFVDSATRARYPVDEHERTGASFVADLRAVLGRRGDDATARALVDDLLARSEEFRELWERQDVAVRRRDRKTLIHPTLGELPVNCLTLESEDATQRLLWFTPVPGTRSVEQFELLSTIGDQDLEPSPIGS
ncbi:helix-turn-helix transcriptional regulator [Nocardioides sp.]|uniref:helix-turn-helix transcriptional regulator n=1 Tax=Nocardioides sp. TaxID=35761 RepID=UPI002ED7FD3F